MGHTIFQNSKTYARADEKRPLKFALEEKILPNKGAASAKKRMDSELRLLVIPSAGNPREAQIFIFNDAWTPDRFSRQTPQEIIQTLRADPAVTYLGKETDAKGQTFEVLQKKQDKNVYLFKADAGTELKDIVPGLIKKIENKEISSAETIDVEEIIRVDANVGRIYQVIHSVHKNGREIERFELTYTDEKYLKYDPDVFDPVRNGLILVSQK